MRGLAALTAALELVVPVRLAGAQATLILDPTSGGVGQQVVGRQAVPRECLTFALRWNTGSGQVLGTDVGTDGLGTVTFTVPPSSIGDHLVVATCSVLVVAGEAVVGQARFFVKEDTPTTTVTTKVNATTTSVAGATTSATRRPSSTTRGTGTTATSVVNPTTVTTSGGSTVTTSGGSTPTTRPLPPPPRDAQECRQQAEEAQAAALLYQPKHTMTVGDTYEVGAALGLDVSDVTAVSLPGRASTTVTLVGGTACKVEATLSGPDFDIQAATAPEQSFAPRRVLSWQWHVTPKRTGALTLVLSLQPKIGDPTGVTLAGAALTVDALITVDSRPESPIRKVGRWSGDFFGHPAVQYLLLPAGSAGFLTLGALAWFRKKRAAGS